MGSPPEWNGCDSRSVVARVEYSLRNLDIRLPLSSFLIWLVKGRTCACKSETVGLVMVELAWWYNLCGLGAATSPIVL